MKFEFKSPLTFIAVMLTVLPIVYSAETSEVPVNKVNRVVTEEITAQLSQMGVKS